MQLNNLDDLRILIEERVKQPIIWVGPRSSDVLGLTDIFKIKGVISADLGEEMKRLNSPLEVLSMEEVIGVREDSSHVLLKEKILESRIGRKFFENFEKPIVYPYNYFTFLEEFCTENGFKSLSSKGEVRDFFRIKTNLSQIHKEVGLKEIPGETGYLKDFEFEVLVKKFGLPLFLQFPKGSAGSGNVIARTRADFERIKKEKGNDRLNIKKFIVGRSFSTDVCITKLGVVCSPVKELIVGVKEITDNPTAYCGSDWASDHITEKAKAQALKMSEKLGEYMAKKGYLGYFNPDFILDEKEGDLYLTEINPRISGSSNTYANLQIEAKEIPLMGLHMLVHLDIPHRFDIDKVNELYSMPKKAAQIYLFSKEKNYAKVGGKVRPGVYKLKKGALEFVRPGINIDVLKNSDEFLVSYGVPRKGTMVGPKAHLLKIVTRRKVIEKTDVLTEWGKEVVNQVQERLDLVEVTDHDEKSKRS